MMAKHPRPPNSPFFSHLFPKVLKTISFPTPASALPPSLSSSSSISQSKENSSQEKPQGSLKKKIVDASTK